MFCEALWTLLDVVCNSIHSSNLSSLNAVKHERPILAALACTVTKELTSATFTTLFCLHSTYRRTHYKYVRTQRKLTSAILRWVYKKMFDYYVSLSNWIFMDIIERSSLLSL